MHSMMLLMVSRSSSTQDRKLNRSCAFRENRIMANGSLTAHRIQVALCLALPITSLAGQSAAAPQRSRVEFLIVGRTETAQVTLDYPPNVAATEFRWSTAPEPLVPGASPSATLRTTLPITIGTIAVPPGAYQLWGAEEAGRMLLIARAMESDSATAAPELRIPLDAQQFDRATDDIAIRIRGTRHGADTLVFTDRSTPRKSVTAIQLLPATTFLLVIDHGRWRLTAPVSAR